jgi:hypothetical protein
VSRVLAAIALTVTVLLTSGCSRSYDAWFANPCAERLTVETFYAERGSNPTVASDERIAKATLRAEGVTKVEDAFQDASGFTWFLKVNDLPAQRLSKEDMPKWFVSLPASVCPQLRPFAPARRPEVPLGH